MHDDRGFLASLFDISFSSFITTKLIKVIFIVSMAGNAMMTLFLVASAFGMGFMWGVFALVFVAPIVFLFFTMLSRIGLELAVVLFRTADFMKMTADNTAEMARATQAVAARTPTQY